ncbi:DUF4124 domain-containing protein [Sinimarinibacterium sp. CAU 1509]|uniref:DUF4124 domain-containing protein n=1 Tax=Sinimarinibacterium sp. CAU 1509 TaxID=2562283 RepID=UPI0010ABCEB9|nr:DUF4124 domain-containing protein [Sinimarinibacterium sp. CAU 1509]TJY59870.1 DUF4124 domain-containing protein [Sinimarinibacterium sp. CAU 1509]
MKSLLTLLLLLPALACADEVYRYVAPDGSVHYTDKPPTKHARPLKFETPSGTTPPSSGPSARRPQSKFYSMAALQAAARFAVSVESPTPGEMVAAGDHPIVGAASVMPGLVSGFHLQFLIDGKPATSEPVDALSVLLPELPPGSHTLTVQLIDPQGLIKAASEATAFTVVTGTP